MTNAEIETVLGASNHYDVLGISREDVADDAILRKAYLRRSVKVHPDKNDGDPQATKAFQRVTQAYNILSDERSRTKYEKSGEEPDTESSEKTYYAGTSGPSFQEAMFVFASVASMMAGARAGAAVDVAQAMYFAETFLSKDKDFNLNDGQYKAQAAMAAGASLRVVGSAVRACGFKKSAAALDSAASLVQVAGIGAMVADTPAVKKALEEPAVKRTLDSGSKTFSQLGESFAAARHAMQNRGEASSSQTSRDSSTANHERSGSTASSEGPSVSASVRSRFSQMGAAARDAVRNRTEATQQKADSSAQSRDEETKRDSKDSYDDSVNKARAAGAAAGSIRKGADTAKKMGFGKQAADLEHAADMAELAGKAAKVAENPMVKSAMQQPAVKRMVEAGGQRLFEHAMKQGTSKTNA